MGWRFGFVMLLMIVAVMRCKLRNRSEFPEPSPDDEVTYQGDLVPGEDHDCNAGRGESGPCDRYRLVWDRDTIVYVTLDSSDDVQWASLDDWKQIEGKNDGRFQRYGRKVRKGDTIGLLPWNVGRTQRVRYTLRVQPRPSQVVAPKPNRPLEEVWKARRAAVLAQKPNDDFQRSRSEYRKTLALRLAGLPRWTKTTTTDVKLDELNPIAITKDDGWCYGFTIELGKGASFSELARRELEIVVRDGRREHRPRKHAFSVGLIVEGTCRAGAGKFELDLRIRGLRGSPYAREIGYGRAKVHVYLHPERPELAMTKGDIKKAIRKYTQGHRLTATLTGRLESLSSLSLRLTQGSCYVGVLELQGAAKLSPEVDRYGLFAEVKLPWEDVDPGPGRVGAAAIFSFGCVARSANATLSIKPRKKGATLGSGPYRLRVFTRGATSKERQCLACQRRYIDCEADRRSGCSHDLETCLRRKRLYEDDCG